MSLRQKILLYSLILCSCDFLDEVPLPDSDAVETLDSVDSTDPVDSCEDITSLFLETTNDDTIENTKSDKTSATCCQLVGEGISVSQSEFRVTIRWGLPTESPLQFLLHNSAGEEILHGETDKNTIQWIPTESGWYNLVVTSHTESIINHTFWIDLRACDSPTTIVHQGDQICIQWGSRIEQNFQLELSSIDTSDRIWTGTTKSPYFRTSLNIGTYRFSYTGENQQAKSLFFERQFDYAIDRKGTTIEPGPNSISEHFSGWINFIADSHPKDTFYRFFVQTSTGHEIVQLETTRNSMRYFVEPGLYRWAVRPFQQTQSEIVPGKLSDWQNFSVVRDTDINVSDSDITLVQDAIRGISIDPDEVAKGQRHFEIDSFPVHGTLSGDKTSFLNYQPNPGYTGIDYAKYRIHAGDRASNTATITFRVVLPQNPTRSYFVPEFGTVNSTEGTPAPPTHTGSSLPQSFAVVSGLGRVIDAIGQNGNVLWRYQKENTWASLAVCNDTLVFCDNDIIYWIDNNSGHLLHTERYPAKLLFVNPTPQGLLVGEWTTDTEQHIAMFWPKTGLLWKLPQAFNWPRWSAIHNNLIVVANTYDSSIIGIDLENGDELFSEDVFFANDVRFLNPQSLLIVEEHADRVWTYDIASKSRNWVVGAANGLENVNLDLDQLTELSHTMRIDPSDEMSYSKSWRGYAGIQTLYAPNGAIALPNGGLYVADTDNHRVVYVDVHGKIVSEITGFNNPNKVSFLTSSVSIPDEICHPER